MKRIEDLGKKEPYIGYYTARWNENAQAFFGLTKLNTQDKEKALETMRGLWEKEERKVAYRMLINDNGKQSIFLVLEANK